MITNVSGLYWLHPTKDIYGYQERTFLPMVEVKAHSTILSTASRTVITQTFVNPADEQVETAKYIFPIHDGASVAGFTCRIGDRVIQGIVKEKQEAKALFDKAVQRGETAGLLEELNEASDVFTTTIGNLPAGATISVEIAYLQELKHDMGLDEIRFTIPTAIAPRYGNAPGELVNTGGAAAAQPRGGIEIVVDVDMLDGSFIREIRSPSHPIAVSLGTTSLAKENPSLHQASATLSLGTAELGSDFVLQIATKEASQPRALLETHNTITGHRALMVTLVPKFTLPPSKPEIVFVVDRSGSMADKISTVVSALKVFLKSLPVGVKFNICSFGSDYSFLWPRSKVYGQATLEEAVKHVQDFGANYGGTEMFEPIKASVDQRDRDMDLEIMLLTDGEIWDQDQLFSYINEQVGESRGAIRVFSLGVGMTVSHSLIEGVARAGRGISQAVSDGERLDGKVVRMLKGALMPHMNDFTLEIKYDSETSAEEDYEMVVPEERDTTGHEEVHQSDGGRAESKPISLFDPLAGEDNDFTGDEAEQKDAQLPDVKLPYIIQAPHRTPTFFPLVRSTVYFLLSPESLGKRPKAVFLRGTSPHGPLELEIPVEEVGIPSMTIHQLAAKKAIEDLEEGRGWVFDANAQCGTPLRKKYESSLKEMAKRESVRLGVQFQVAGKSCSFVAVCEGNLISHALPYRTPEATSIMRFSAAPGGSRGGFGSRGGGGGRGGYPMMYSMAPVSTMASGRGIFAQRHCHVAAAPKRAMQAFFMPGGSHQGSESTPVKGDSRGNSFEELMDLQLFEGSWDWTKPLCECTGVQESRVQTAAPDGKWSGKVLATALAVAYFETKHADQRWTWELLVEKARSWLEGECGAEGMNECLRLMTGLLS